MLLVTLIDRRKHISDLDLELAGSHVPGTDKVKLDQLIDEVPECHSTSIRSLTRARSGAVGRREVERFGVARINKRHRVFMFRDGTWSSSGGGNRHRVATIGRGRADGHGTSALASNCDCYGCDESHPIRTN